MYVHTEVNGFSFLQVESALEFEAGPIRAKTLKMLRDMMAKHDCDQRYSEAVSPLCRHRVSTTITHQHFTYFLKPALLIVALGLLNMLVSGFFFEKAIWRIFANPVTYSLYSLN